MSAEPSPVKPSQPTFLQRSDPSSGQQGVQEIHRDLNFSSRSCFLNVETTRNNVSKYYKKSAITHASFASFVKNETLVRLDFILVSVQDKFEVIIKNTRCFFFIYNFYLIVIFESVEMFGRPSGHPS